jgi:hypothetical protein
LLAAPPAPLPSPASQMIRCRLDRPRVAHQPVRKQRRKQLRSIAVPLAQPALQLGDLQQQLIAARKLGLGRCSATPGRVGECGGAWLADGCS